MRSEEKQGTRENRRKNLDGGHLKTLAPPAAGDVQPLLL